MNLISTPYITIRNRNGLKTIDYTQCDILENENQAAARSYNTIIGVYTRTSTGQQVYLETAGSYSQTTASKHKPRAAAIAAYNNYKIIEDIKPEILFNQYFYNKYCIDEILQESQQRQELIKQLKDGKTSSFLINNLKVNGTITAARDPKTKNYKNGNHQTKYYYKVNFKYSAPVYYEVITKHIETIIPGYNSSTGPKPEQTTYKIQTRPAHIEY